MNFQVIPTKSSNPNIQMIKDLFPHLNDRYIEVSETNYFNNFKPILSLNANVRSVLSKASNVTVAFICSSVNSPMTFSAMIDASSSLIFPT